MSAPVDRHVPARAPSEAMRLAQAAACGDEAAIAALLKLLTPRLSTIVRAILGRGHPDIDDAIQQTLIGLVRAMPAFRGECDPAGYGARIAVRIAVAARKQAQVQRSRIDPEGEIDAPAPGAGDPVLANRRKEALRELLASLPCEQAETLAMRVVLGWSLEEIARHTSTPLNTVRSRLRLAKQSLRHRIEVDPSLMELLGVDT